MACRETQLALRGSDDYPVYTEITVVHVELGGRHEVEVGDDRPQAGPLVVLVEALEDEDRVDAERRHHPCHGSERRLGRTADDAAAHRVADGCRLERDV